MFLGSDADTKNSIGQNLKHFFQIEIIEKKKPPKNLIFTVGQVKNKNKTSSNIHPASHTLIYRLTALD